MPWIRSAEAAAMEEFAGEDERRSGKKTSRAKESTLIPGVRLWGAFFASDSSWMGRISYSLWAYGLAGRPTFD